MDLIAILVFLIILGLIYYLILQIPLAAPFPTIIKIVFIVILLLWLLQFFGFGNFSLRR